jgi:hypothetical protein
MMGEEVLVAGVGEVVELLHLPGMKSFAVVIDAVVAFGRVDLFSKDCRVAGKVEGFSGYDRRGLVIAMIFAGDVRGHPGEDDLGASQADEANNFIKRCTMAQRFKRVKHILSSCVGAVQEPDVFDSARCQGTASFHLAFVRHGFALLHAGRVSARVTASCKDGCYALVFIQGCTGDVVENAGIVVGMSDDEENIRLKTIIWLW